MELLELCEKQIPQEYFEILQVASTINVLCAEIGNDNVTEKVDELLEFMKKEGRRVLAKNKKK